MAVTTVPPNSSKIIPADAPIKKTQRDRSAS